MFLLLGPRYSQDVLRFCAKHGLTESLDLVVELMYQTFPEAHGLTVSMEQDPESEHQWIMVDAMLRGSPQEIHQRHRECVARILNSLPWQAFTRIRTIYTLA